MSQIQSPSWDDLAPLLNPPLLLSVAAESLAGSLLAGVAPGSLAPYLFAAASALLFGAGSLFGHYFDRDRDRRFYPDRPLVCGKVDTGFAWRLGLALLCLGSLSLFGGGVLVDSLRWP